jgi:hypothetical protein
MNNPSTQKTELIYNHVSLWPRHHAECVEMALRAKDQGSRVLFLSCKDMLLGCPVNPYRNKDLCAKCVKQTERTENILTQHGIETYVIETGHESTDLIVDESCDELLNFLYDGMPIGRTVFNNISTILGDIFFDSKNAFAQEILRNTISLFNFIKYFVEKNQIDKVSVWNGRRSCDGAVVLAAKSLGIEYSVFISGAKHMSVSMLDNSLAFQDIRYHRSKLKELYNRFDQENDWDSAKDAASKYYHMAQGGENGLSRPYGMPVCSKSFVDSGTAFGDSGKIKLAVFVGTYLEIGGVEGFNENLDVEYGDFYEAVRRICLDEEILGSCQVVVRWHPNTRVRGNERSRLIQVVDETSKDVAHYLPEDPYDSYKLLSDADKVLVVGSSMALEAAYLKKQVIFVGNAIFDEFSLPVVSKHHELVSNVLDYPRYNVDKLYKESLVYGYYRLTRSNFLIEKIQYVERDRYRSAYVIDKHVLIDMKAEYYLPKLFAYRAGITPWLKTIVRSYKKIFK